MTDPAVTDARVTEFALAELVGDTWRPLTQAGSWYTDRYYADDLTGRAAAEAALDRVAAAVPGTYRVDELRTFTRPPHARAVVVVVDEPDDEQGCEGHESLAGEHMGETVYCDGTCR
jgi:hypothetical protein